MRTDIGVGNRVVLASGETAIVREILDDRIVCIVDIVGKVRRAGVLDRPVLIESLVPASEDRSEAGRG